MITMRCAICGRYFDYELDEDGLPEYTENLTILVSPISETWHHQKCYEEYIRYDNEAT